MCEVSGLTERGESALQVNIRMAKPPDSRLSCLELPAGHNGEIQAKLSTAISKSSIDAVVFCVRLDG